MYKSNTPKREEADVTVRHSTGSGARVDRDHDHLLREFMEAQDE
jgi:hypothetical protein